MITAFVIVLSALFILASISQLLITDDVQGGGLVG